MEKILVWHERGYGKYPRISFQEWKRKGGGKPGTKYIVFRVFTPKRFPTYSLRWIDPEMNVEVAASIRKDIFQRILEAGWNSQKLLYYVVVDEFTDGFAIEENQGKIYQQDEYGYILRHASTENTTAF